MGGHYGNMEDGGCQTSKINQVATAAGAKPADGKGRQEFPWEARGTELKSRLAWNTRAPILSAEEMEMIDNG